MAKSLVNVSWVDYFGKKGTFGFYVDSTYDDGTFAEVKAHIQDILDASNCAVEKITIAREVSIATLTGNTAVESVTGGRIDDQAVIRWQSSAGEMISTTVPGPVDSLFDASGAYAGQDVNIGGALALALKATGETTPLLVTKAENVVSLVKGWRKGQKHS